MLASCLNNHPRMRATVKSVHRQTFVSELAVEALISAVLPGFAGLNQQITQTLCRCPLHQRQADKLRTVVASQD